MRALIWNTARNFNRKAERLHSMDAQILILAEVEEQHANALGEGYETLWFGDSGKIGLLVAVQKPLSIEFIQEATLRHAAMLSVSLGDSLLQLIPVWTMKNAGSYVKPLCSALDELLPLIGPSKRVLVAGDFNSSPVFDKGPEVNHFANISNRLGTCGLFSLWHERTGEPFGSETKPTHFHQWKTDRPFHIDYAFASEQLRKETTQFEIGSSDDWLVKYSDHMPLIADFQIDRSLVK